MTIPLSESVVMAIESEDYGTPTLTSMEQELATRMTVKGYSLDYISHKELKRADLSGSNNIRTEHPGKVFP